jgi:N4-gp56 family major capsid protein
MTGVAQVDNSIIELMDSQFVLAAAEMGTAEQFVSLRKNIGAKSIEMPKYSQMALATSPLTEDEDVVSTALADSQIIFTPVEYGAVVTSTALSRVQTGGMVDLVSSRLVGMNMGRTQDKLAITALEASANSIIVDGGTEAALEATDVMTVSFLNKLYNKLSRANVMPLSDGMYVCMMHSDQIFDLLNSGAASGGFIDILKYSKPEMALKNEIGMLAGFKIVQNNHITVSADAGAGAVDTYKAIAMGYNALGKAVSKEPAMIMTSGQDKLNRFVNLGWSGIFRYGIVDQDALWTGITASSVGANA